jgi:HAE1 family hydrophobic/amphiphilic exporter-1
MVVLACFMILDGFIGKRLPTSFLPDEDYGFLFLNAQLPPAASLARTTAVADKVQSVLSNTPGVAHFTTIVGYSFLSRVSTTNNSLFFVELKPWSERRSPSLDSKAILANINRQLTQQIPEAVAFAFNPPPIPGLGNAGGFSLWLQDRSGGSVEDLDQGLQRFLQAARRRPELTGVNSQFSARTPQVFATVDRDKALKQGVSLGDVYQVLQTSLGGLYVNQFNRFGRQWKVFLEAEAEDRTSAASIDQYYVRDRAGTMVPLSTLVSTKPINGPDYTNRFNLFRAAQIIGSAAPGYSSGQAQAALEEVARETLPATMGYDWADLSYQENKASGTAGPIFALSLLVVFLILAALYESWSLPFSVLLSVPIAIFGAFMGLYLRRFDLDIYAQIGLVMLIGLAAKNAILIVEFARDEMAKGRDVVSAALEGAKLRLRPILMTSFAFILGCIPLAVASGSGAVGREILGTVVVAGMLAATLLAIFVIPVLFVLFERIALSLHEARPSGMDLRSLPTPEDAERGDD